MKINKQNLLVFFRIEKNKLVKLNLITILIGIFLYIISNSFELPIFPIGLIPLQIDFSMVIIAISSVFGGPLVGLLVGYLGSLMSDLIFNNQVIAYSLLNLSYGLFGLVIGIPRFHLSSLINDKRRTDRLMLKLLLTLLLGFIVFTVFYLFSLIVVGQHSVMGVMLYNYFPILGKYLLSLLVYTPLIIYLMSYFIQVAKSSKTISYK